MVRGHNTSDKESGETRPIPPRDKEEVVKGAEYNQDLKRRQPNVQCTPTPCMLYLLGSGQYACYALATPCPVPRSTRDRRMFFRLRDGLTPGIITITTRIKAP